MNKLKALACFSLFIFHFSFSYSQQWIWGRQGSGSIKSNDYGSPVAEDKWGNAYITGQFESSITFGTTTLTGTYGNAYLVKYNPGGTLVWALAADDISGASYSASVATDPSGNVFMAGMFTGTVMFGSKTLTSATSGYEAYIVKFDSSGTALWAAQGRDASVFSYSDQTIYGVTVDKSGNAIMTGAIKDTSSFGTYILYPKAYTETAITVKYDPSGNVLWAEPSTGSTTNDMAQGNAVSTDNSGNVYVTGNFTDTVSFGGYTIISKNTSSTYLVKYSPAGSVLWVKQAINGTISSLSQGNAIVTDQAGNIYINGVFSNIVTFGSHTLYSPTTYAAFLTKFDTLGNTIWAKQSSPGWAGSSLSADANNQIYMSGSNYRSVDSLIFGGVRLSPSPWATDASFVIRFDSSGDSRCASILNNLRTAYNLEDGVGVASDPSGRYIYMGGTFGSDTLVCGPDTLVSSGGGENVFIGRWGGCNNTEAINELKANRDELKIFPNPFSYSTTILLTYHSPLITYHYLELYDLTGQKLKQIEFTGNSYTLSADGLAKGMYFIRIFDKDNTVIGTSKIAVQ